MSVPRKAVLVATTVEVLCPYCAEPHDSPSGTQTMWALGVGDFGPNDQGRDQVCAACDKTFRIDPLVRPMRLGK